MLRKTAPTCARTNWSPSNSSGGACRTKWRTSSRRSPCCCWLSAFDFNHHSLKNSAPFSSCFQTSARETPVHQLPPPAILLDRQVDRLEHGRHSSHGRGDAQGARWSKQEREKKREDDTSWMSESVVLTAPSLCQMRVKDPVKGMVALEDWARVWMLLSIRWTTRHSTPHHPEETDWPWTTSAFRKEAPRHQRIRVLLLFQLTPRPTGRFSLTFRDPDSPPPHPQPPARFQLIAGCSSSRRLRVLGRSEASGSSIPAGQVSRGGKAF